MFRWFLVFFLFWGGSVAWAANPTREDFSALRSVKSSHVETYSLAQQAGPEDIIRELQRKFRRLLYRLQRQVGPLLRDIRYEIRELARQVQRFLRRFPGAKRKAVPFRRPYYYKYKKSYKLRMKKAYPRVKAYPRSSKGQGYKSGGYKGKSAKPAPSVYSPGIIHWQTRNFQEGLRLAEKANKPVLLYFGAAW